MFNKLKNTKFTIVEHFKYFICVSLAIVLIAGIAQLIGIKNSNFGMDVGIDFTGGAKIEVEIANANDANEKDVKDSISKALSDAGCSVVDDIQNASTASDTSKLIYEIRLKFEINGEEIDSSEFIGIVQGDLDDDSNNGVCGDIETNLQELLGSKAEISAKAYTVGSTASKTLLRNAFLALGLAIVLMLIYILIRFKFASALAAIVALFHDVLIMVAMTIIFRIPVNSTFIAAIITIVGYSINATIVIFDRIREAMKFESAKSLTDEEIANTAIKNTLTRSILTSLTTLVMVALLAILGVSAIQEFIVPIIFGLIAGTYSSVFLASSFWVIFRKAGRKIKANKTNKAKTNGAKA